MMQETANENATGLRRTCNRFSVNWRHFFRHHWCFVKGGEPENLEKNPGSKPRTSNELDLHMTRSRNPAQATLVVAKRR